MCVLFGVREEAAEVGGVYIFFFLLGRGNVCVCVCVGGGVKRGKILREIGREQVWEGKSKMW